MYSLTFVISPRMLRVSWCESPNLRAKICSNFTYVASASIMLSSVAAVS